MKSFVLAALAASMIVATPGVSSAQIACTGAGYNCPTGNAANPNGGQYRGHGVNRGYHRRARYYRGDGGFDGGGVAALAAGALIGGALASQLQQPIAGNSDYCARRYRSYDPASGTYLGYDGLRHPC